MVNDQTTNQRLERGAELPNILSPKPVNRVNHDHDNIKVDKGVAFSDERDSDILSKSPVECNSWSNDSNGLQCSAERAVSSWWEVFFNSRISFNQIKQSSKHACLVLFSSFCATGAALNGGVHSHQVLATSSSQQVRGIETTQPRGLRHDKNQSELRFECQWWMMRSKHILLIRSILKYQLARDKTKKFLNLPTFPLLLSVLIKVQDWLVGFVLMR